MVKPVRDTLNFLSQPFETDALKAEVEHLRQTLTAKDEGHKLLVTALELNVADLTMLKAKTDFLANLMGRELDMFVPPEPEGIEKKYDELEEKYYDPLESYALGFGSIGAALYVGANAIPFTMAVVGKISRISRLAKWAGSAKWAKLANFGKASVYLAIAAGFLEVALKLTSAKEINAHLTAKQNEIEDQITQADQMIVRIEYAYIESRDQREKLLFDLGFGPFSSPDSDEYEQEIAEAVSEYLRRANTSGEEMTVSATVKKSVRNLLIMGQSPADIVDLLGSTYEAVNLPMVEALARRVEAELLILDGAEQDHIAREIGISTFQVAVIARVLRARADAARGYQEDVLSERFGISDAVADLQVDLAESAMAQSWDEIASGDGDPAVLSRSTLVPPEALEDIMQEVPIRQALLDGAKSDEIQSVYPNVTPARIAELHQDTLERSQSILKDVVSRKATRELSDSQLVMFAVALRVPTSVVRTA